jgi:DNA-directed RNA polymerase subunit M/transcription elongation factor TFIIS
MQQVNPSGQPATIEQQKINEERKKLDDDLKAGKISQAEYFKKKQALEGGMPNPAQGMPGAPVPIQPAGMVTPITPLSPQQAGPKEEVPPVGQPLAIGSEDVEVVECYKCAGLITITTKERPVIIACPSCGTKGEVDASEPEKIEVSSTPKATDGVTVSEDKIFQFASEPEDKQTTGPSFGASLDDDLVKQDQASQPKQTPPTQPQLQPAVQPSAVTPTTPEQPQTQKPTEKKTE